MNRCLGLRIESKSIGRECLLGIVIKIIPIRLISLEQILTILQFPNIYRLFDLNPLLHYRSLLGKNSHGPSLLGNNPIILTKFSVHPFLPLELGFRLSFFKVCARDD